MAKEKFPMEEVENAKARLRVEETLPEAEKCADCGKARAATGDATYLCPAHLQWVLLGGEK